MKRNIILIVIIFIVAVCVAVFAYKILENKKILNSKEEIREFIKTNMNNSWTYEDSKLTIDDDLNTTIILFNVEDVVDCYESSLTFTKDLKSAYTDNLNINTITFACKTNTEDKSSGYIEISDIKNLDIRDFKNSIVLYNQYKNTINQSVDDYKKEMKENYIKKCKNFNYEEIFRNSEDYVGEYATFTGEVVQVLDGSGFYEIRLNITKDEYGYYTDTIMVYMSTNVLNERILEEDIITVYGKLTDLIKYESIFGETITIPGINVRYAELVS